MTWSRCHNSESLVEWKNLPFCPLDIYEIEANVWGSISNHLVMLDTPSSRSQNLWDRGKRLEDHSRVFVPLASSPPVTGSLSSSQTGHIFHFLFAIPSFTNSPSFVSRFNGHRVTSSPIRVPRDRERLSDAIPTRANLSHPMCLTFIPVMFSRHVRVGFLLPFSSSASKFALVSA